MVGKELRDPAKGLDFSEARTYQEETGAEPCICSHNPKLCNILIDSSRISCTDRMRGIRRVD